MKWASAVGALFLDVINLGAFVETTTFALEDGKDRIRKKWHSSLRAMLASPEFDALARVNPLMGQVGGLKELPEALAKRSIRLAGQTVNSAALVFAHTLLDGVLSDCCQIIFQAKPEEWYRFVEKRKVELGTLKMHGKDRVLKNSADEFVRQLARESMTQRLRLLNSLCAPKLKGGTLPTVWISLEKLEAFDQMRHKVVHGRTFARKQRGIGAQLQFAAQAGFSCLVMVGDAYGLSQNLQDLTVSRLRSLRVWALLKREFPEFIELIERHEEKLDDGGPRKLT